MYDCPTVLTIEDALTRLHALGGQGALYGQGKAEVILCACLRGLGADAVAQAYEEASQEDGFYYR